jgi:hypothetical protein
MDAAGLTGPSWLAWRAFWSAVFALPMDAAQLELFRRSTGRTVPSSAPSPEAWQIVGRRGGKSRNAGIGAMYLGIRRNYTALLAPGERGVIPVIAADRKQAGQVLRYIKGLADLPAFRPYVARSLKESLELTTGVTIEVHTASYRTVRGYSVIGVIADEVAFWRSDESVNPDSEILNALRPGMANVPGALLLGLSTPYARRGELFKAWERGFAKDESDTLVWVAPSVTMNPSLDARVVARAMEDDPVAAASEYGAEWRRDVEAFLTPEAIAAVTVRGRLELPPRGRGDYVAFVDPSGGAQDAFTFAIAHPEGECAVLDLVREVRPPFSPDTVVRDFCQTIKTYGILTVRGDAYGGEWPGERFAVHGVDYELSELTRSDLYKALLPMVNAGRVELLDVPRLRAQLLGLERRVARGGKDSVDHAPGGHDDVANAAAGALVGVGGPQTWERWIQAAKEGTLTGALRGSGSQPAATRVIVHPGERWATSQRCPCGAVFNVGDRVETCPACGTGARGTASRHLD